jgi:hypothetical protein
LLGLDDLDSNQPIKSQLPRLENSAHPAFAKRREQLKAADDRPRVRRCARASRIERPAACLRGGLGQFEAKHLMLLAMAHAGRLGKYGA